MNYQGTIDFAIIAIREDEYHAVLQRFPSEQLYSGNHRNYAISTVQISNGRHYRVALATSIEQGPGHAQDVARDMIEDLKPQWLVVVGIAGAFPDKEFSLGDVVVAKRLRDFSVSAVTEHDGIQLVDQGGPMSKEIQDLIAQLPAMQEKLAGWNEQTSIGVSVPPVDIDTSDNFYGNLKWKKRVKEALETRFGEGNKPRPPLVTSRTIVSSGQLLKNSVTAKRWQEQARDIAAVEMELAGVYTAARRRNHEYPILAVRAISDIVGFKRDPQWTTYACHSAAAFVHAFIKAEPLSPRMETNTNSADATDKSGKFLLNVSGDAQGMVQGDNSIVSMNFGIPPTRK